MTFLHGLLVILIILHIWWFGFIVNVIYSKIVLDREVDDIREDDDAVQEAIEEAKRQAKANSSKGGKAN